MTAAPGLEWLEAYDSVNAVVSLRSAEKGRPVWVSRGLAEMVGHSREEIIESPELDGVEISPSELVEQVIPMGQTAEEIRWIDIRGQQRWLRTRYVPVPPELTAGNGWCVLVSGVDVTADVQLAALNALVGLRSRNERRLEGEEAFVRLLLAGHGIQDIATALDMSVEQVSARLVALAGTPLG
jgi:hypothetical protein